MLDALPTCVVLKTVEHHAWCCIAQRSVAHSADSEIEHGSRSDALC